MAVKLRLVFSITIAFLSFYGSAQNRYWKKESSTLNEKEGFPERFNIHNGAVFSFEEDRFKKELLTLSATGKNSKVVYFPDDTGEPIPFLITESPVMSEALSAKYPSIKSYKGYGIKDRAERIRFSVSDDGIESMMVNVGGSGSLYMQKSRSGKYVVYRRNKDSPSDIDFICGTRSLAEKGIRGSTLKPVDGQVLRKFRLAISATGEYTTYHGGTVAGALAAINATVTRINEVYETDLGVTLELVANNDLVIFTNAATDPYTSNLNTQVQNTLTSIIGPANYDVGHLFQKGANSGDAGFVGAVCIDNRKGSAYSSAVDPMGDTYDIDFVAHEMGHQFGANHTWSFESEGTLVQAEPGSGTTIMGYAGITGVNNVALHGDDYFHYLSIVQIADYIETAACGEIIPLTNNPPVVSGSGDFVIPKSTAFFLEGSATDPDASDVLSYTWEQIDDGIVTNATFGPTNPSGANFRSQIPTSDARRFFPKLSSVLQGNLTQTSPTVGSTWETVSDIERNMNFAFTVRDNAEGGGQVVSDLVEVSVVNSAGPFKVISQASNITITAGDILDVQWNVANTEKAPINAISVDIFLSIDGGNTFPVVLAQDVPNDGTHKIVVPGNPSTQARIMVQGHGNIFYAVNDANFVIEASEIVLNFPELQYGVCQPNNLVVPFIYETYLGFNEEATFSLVSIPPPGLDFAFSPATATSSNTPVNLTFSNTQIVPEGIYTIRVLAATATKSKVVEIQVNINDSNFTEVVLVSPADDAQDVSKGLALQWQADPMYTAYEVQVATNASFTNIVQTATVISDTYLPPDLANETTYYWRVKPKNNCGEGVYGPASSFTTIQFNCANKPAIGLPTTISTTGTPVISSKIAFYEDLILADLNVNLEIDHSFLADLVVSLTSPQGTTVVLVSSSCGGLSNINATFDDSANAFICGGVPAIQGVVKPLGSLNSFNGESILGEWILQISDNAPSDGGSLKAFSLEMCVEGQFRPDADNDGIFDDGDDLCLGTPEGTEVNSQGCPVYRFPKNNFAITAQSESCSSNNDGALTLTATLPIDYMINVNGNTINITENFANTFTLSDLGSGIYDVCINGTDGTIQYEPYCLEVNITEPQPFSVTSKTSIDGKEVTLSLEGNDLYFIELNGKINQIEASEITLNLKLGKNNLKVSTELPCQGIYEEELFVSDRPVVYPNPFTDLVKIFLGTGIQEMEVVIFGPNGQFIQSGQYQINGTEMQLDLSFLPSGMYFLKLESQNMKAVTKLIKK